MTVRTWAAALGLGALLATGPLWAASQPSEAQVRELMQLMRVSDQLAAMNTQMVSMMRQQLPCVPASYWESYIDKSGQEQLVKAMLPAYQHHFSAEDVEGLIKFYRSPLGQKLVAQMPATMTEASQAGQQWSQQRTSDLFATLQKEGKLDSQGHCPAEGGSGSGGGPAAASEPARAGSSGHP